ncbi:MAG: hypothetical protein CMB80_11720 [Flammeovirgaceae bacterium]|nr:hypothetical protein [Flammeovirgaceae bacterium]MBE61505.1 hypothetical protein [Flammeovirgaceae bacterium]MBR10850.1 hypothetical protein [Rickettsiales bacterium]HCX23335.1 hypothetical protein [Cytophagales bacterium]|tara:strand:+ start:2304 stop:3155 length:852 start_codon:yes stop_codon:yes gene_type:complete
MKKILVPTDYSSLSINALDFAIDLAQASGAEIHLVHFLGTPIEPATFTELLADNTESRTEFVSDLKLDHHKSKLNEIASSKASLGIKISTELGGSGVVSGSEKYVSSFDIDLIVLGADDVEDEKGEFPVKVSQELTQFVKVPVVSLTEHVDYVDLTKVVLGVDPVKNADNSDLAKLIGPVLKSLDAHIHLVDVVKAGEVNHSDHNGKLEAFGNLADFGKFDVKVLEHENDLEGILKYADELDAGLVAVVSDGRPNIFRFFKDSFATTMVKATDLPVMVFNSNN